MQREPRLGAAYYADRAEIEFDNALRAERRGDKVEADSWLIMALSAEVMAKTLRGD